MLNSYEIQISKFRYLVFKSNFFRLLTAIFLLALSIFIDLPASAEPSHLEYLTSLSIEELMQIKVSSTGFFNMSHQKAPGTIWLLSNEQIENSSAMNMSDLLNFYIPGIYIGNNVRYGSLVSSRGIAMPNNSSTLFLLDGQGINAGSGVGVNSGLKLPLLGDIDRLEVINGPCSIVHGSGAINGFVNIKPKNGSEYPGYFINTQYGFIEKLVKTEIGYGYSYGHKKDIFIYAGGAYADGFEDEVEVDTRYPVINKLAGERQVDVYGMPEPNYKWALYWNHNLIKLNLLFQREIYENNSYYKYLGETSNSEQTSFIVHPGIKIDLSQHESLRLSLPFEFYDTGVNYDNFENKDDEGSSEFHVEAKSIFKTTRFKNQKIALGTLIGLRHFRAGKYYFSEDPLQPGSSIDADWLEQSIFFEDIYRITHKWTVSAGLRYDLIAYSSASSSELDINSINNDDDNNDITPDNADILTPRIATSYEINSLNIIKFSYQEGFHYPNLKYFEYTLSSGSELRPERVKSYELNYHFNFEKYKAEFDFNIYYNIFRDSFLAKSNEDDNTLSDNANLNEILDDYTNASEEFAALGGEVTIKWQPIQDTTLRFSYGYSRPKGHDDLKISIANRGGSKWTRYPEHIIKSDITQKFLNNRLIMNLNFLYNCPTDTTDTKDPEPYDMYDHTRFITNLYAKYLISDNLSIKLTGQNLLKNDVPPVSSYIEPDWNANSAIDEPLFYLGLSWKY